MTVVYDRFGVTVHAGDCLEMIAGLPDASVHAVVTDPPYGIRFMGKAWDGEDIEAGVAVRRSQAPMLNDGKAGTNGGYRSAAAEAGRYDPSANAAFGEWCRRWAAECLRVLKPGGHLLAFGGCRTWHRLAAAVEDAGFEVRDSIAWLYASGFPKSLDVSKAIDKAAGAEREVVGRKTLPNGQLRREEGPGTRADGSGWARPWQTNPTAIEARTHITAPATDAARAWQGWGTALKPAFEPIVVARKPLDGTVAGNVLEYGAGALNIDGCRIEAGQDYRDKCASVVGLDSNRNGDAYGEWTGTRTDSAHAAGRWPTNVVLTHAATPDGVDLCVDGCLDGCPVNELGEAARFFPVFRFEAKAPAAERPRVDGVAHPTVKPLALMRWLVRLVTPPAGVVLDPFLGSGTTAQAARAEGFQCVGIEREESYLPLIRERLDGGPGDLFGGVA